PAAGLLRQRHPPERDRGRRRSRRRVLAEHQRHRRPGARDLDQHRPGHRGRAGRERRGRRSDAGAERRPGMVPVRRGAQPALPPDGPARLGVLDLHPAQARGGGRGGPADPGLPAGHARLGAAFRPGRPGDRRQRRRLPRAGGGPGRATGSWSCVPKTAERQGAPARRGRAAPSVGRLPGCRAGQNAPQLLRSARAVRQPPPGLRLQGEALAYPVPPGPPPHRAAAFGPARRVIARTPARRPPGRRVETVMTRQECAATVLGGPTTVLDLGGLRIVSDPTFDDPGPHGYLTKTAGPAVAEDQLGPVDLVLISHDNHPDNLDDRGRALALAAPLVLTTRSGARRLGPPATGLPPWTSHTVPRPDGGDLIVTAVPAVHGPEDAERDADGFVNTEVIGFVLSGPDLPVIYVSGDNASIATVAEIARRTPSIDAVVLHAGAARVPARFRNRALSLDSVRAAAAAAILGPAEIIPAHYDGWTHFSEGRDDLVRAFDDAGLTARLRLVDHGTWIPLRP